MISDQVLFITQLLTLWAVLDPVSHLPLFMAATQDLTEAGRRQAAIAAVLFAFAALSIFGLLGQYLLHAMGISLLSFQISGGLILLLFALNMVLGEHRPPTIGSAPAAARTDTVMSVAVYPLAIPIIAGPGSMLSMVMLIDNQRFSFSGQMVTLLALVVALAILLVVLLLGELVRRVIGEPGIQLIRRVMGLILAALSVNLILDAVATWLKLPPI